MAGTLTPMQKKAVDAVLAKVQYYLDSRYAQIRRINPKTESVWEDLVWQQMTALRTSLSLEKIFGPVRFNVAETLLSDDLRKRQELFMRKSQNCLIGEIVEEKEKEGHRTSGAMEIHDMRTLFHAIDASLESIVILIQTFIWWDLEDACDWARFEKKISIIRAFEENGITPEMAEYYQNVMAATTRPQAEDVIIFECRNLRRTLDLFRTRRGSDQGYQIILKREQTQMENPDLLIDAIAGQQNLLKSLRAGQPLQPAHADQFARAMGVDPDDATPDRVAPFLEQMIAGNKKRLKAALNGQGSGNPVNLKRQQLEEMEARFAEVVKNRNVEEPANS